MKLQYARKLQSGDEVTVKATQETVTVIKVYPYPAPSKKKARYICVEAMTKDGYKTLSYLDIS